ncbi:hypothetical protein [Streptomyces sp. NBC_00212]|uniref:hypothetical protein n=1 Tax=Streptomyces sp. NBC_00212 TaxID=2975684 RepID=UPI003863E1C9
MFTATYAVRIEWGWGMEVEERQLAAAPGPFTAFLRFVLCGGGLGVASSSAVALLALLLPWALANALVTAASTALATELHARFTFQAGGRAGWRRHVQSAGSAAGAYVVTCLAMVALHALVASPNVLAEQAVYLSASGLAGLGRFIVLRLFVFTDAHDQRQDSPGTSVHDGADARAEEGVHPRPVRRRARESARTGSALRGPSPGRARQGRRQTHPGVVGRRRRPGGPVCVPRIPA